MPVCADCWTSLVTVGGYWLQVITGNDKSIGNVVLQSKALILLLDDREAHSKKKAEKKKKI